MADNTLDEVLADVTEQTTLIDGVQAFIDGLKAQLADALSGATLPPAVQAKVNAVFASSSANKAKLAQALLDNTPQAAAKR